MDFYERWILPPLLDLVMRRQDLARYRRAAVAAARGRVLEIGVGSGLNFALYGKQVELVYGIDPSARLLAIARRRAAASGIPAELLQASATAIPLVVIYVGFDLGSARFRLRDPSAIVPRFIPPLDLPWTSHVRPTLEEAQQSLVRGDVAPRGDDFFGPQPPV